MRIAASSAVLQQRYGKLGITPRRTPAQAACLAHNHLVQAANGANHGLSKGGFNTQSHAELDAQASRPTAAHRSKAGLRQEPQPAVLHTLKTGASPALPPLAAAASSAGASRHQQEQTARPEVLAALAIGAAQRKQPGGLTGDSASSTEASGASHPHPHIRLHLAHGRPVSTQAGHARQAGGGGQGPASSGSNTPVCKTPPGRLRLPLAPKDAASPRPFKQVGRSCCSKHAVGGCLWCVHVGCFCK